MSTLGLPLVLLVQAFYKGGSSTAVDEEVEEGSGDEDEEAQGESEIVAGGECEQAVVTAGGGGQASREPRDEVDEGGDIPEILERL